MKHRITPLDQLRQEKDMLRRECADSEARLAEHWEYARSNVGSMIFHSAIHGLARKMGLIHSKEPQQHKKGGGASGLFQGLLGSAITIAPIVWDVAHPMIIKFVVHKVTSIIAGKKKKKKDKE